MAKYLCPGIYAVTTQDEINDWPGALLSLGPGEWSHPQQLPLPLTTGQVPSADDCRGLLDRAAVWVLVLAREVGAEHGHRKQAMLRHLFEQVARMDDFSVQSFRQGVAREAGIGLREFNALLKVAREEAAEDDGPDDDFEIVVDNGPCRHSLDGYRNADEEHHFNYSHHVLISFTLCLQGSI